jgi:hypothetical protein
MGNLNKNPGNPNKNPGKPKKKYKLLFSNKSDPGNPS